MKDLTEIVFILDRSGSMANLTDDTIGGVNTFIESQRKVKGNANLTLVLFDNEYEVVYEGLNIKNVKELTNKIYYARGTTALLDAVGKTINNISNKFDNLKVKPSKVIFVIITDGYENASVEYKRNDIKTLVESKRDWEFLFLGANIDSFSEAGSVGISLATTSNYSATGRGMTTGLSAVSNAVDSYRTNGTISKDWNKDIE